ncbi:MULTISPECIES: hypothetical protein [Sporosarcina]|uniref:Uncharacterized protein n=1 Tax=Sporosarcina psychrophila TaxID=1476 RepID=A0ABV2KB77_SPOPS
MKIEREIIIQELRAMNVQYGPFGQTLHQMDYRSLVSLLAVQRAVAE